MTPLKVIVIGAGVSGLAAANRLIELSQEKNIPIDLNLLEAGKKAGGTLRRGPRLLYYRQTRRTQSDQAPRNGMAVDAHQQRPETILHSQGKPALSHP
jgi:cation diffusion facilitator CzcD-associated flavoprotein CzcO